MKEGEGHSDVFVLLWVEEWFNLLIVIVRNLIYVATLYLI